MKLKKILFYNFIFFFIYIIIFELFFGYWLDQNNYGIFIRNERLIEKNFQSTHNNKVYNVNYRRNFYGFRGENVDPSDIKIVFHGGSTGNQKFTPERYTIVEIINDSLKKENIQLKLHNASTDGKTTRGFANDFKNWFSKIQNFNPKIFIFYIGINDSILSQNSKYDTGIRTSWHQQLFDYIKNNSKICELIIKIYNKYFAKYYISYATNEYLEGLYDNFKYINFDKANSKFIKSNFSFSHNRMEDEEKKLIKVFHLRLKKLNVILKEKKITPIFLTQIQYNGLANKNLFIINQELKKFAHNNNYYLIKLDEIIDDIQINDFYDKSHTQISGTKKITNKIYPQLKKILIEELLDN